MNPFKTINKQSSLSSENPSRVIIDGRSLSCQSVSKAISTPGCSLEISKDSLKKVENSHLLLKKFVKNKRIIYGVNTSMGGFVNWLIPLEFARQLQENLISAVATNIGDFFEDKVVRASILARINSLARGSSGISKQNLLKLVEIYNAGIIPCVPSKGSLGASGDLGPLAAIALVATGKWKAKFKGKIYSGDEALQKAGISPMVLSFKEGLCLINGTSAMTALAALNIEKAKNLVKTYDIISAITFEGLKVKQKPFDPIVHAQKQHRGQLVTAKNLSKLLSTSGMIVNEQDVENTLKDRFNGNPTSTDIPIEDAYSIRCTPQIIGPVRDTIQWIQNIIENELNSSNDNPLILPEHNEVFHNGHFHGQYVSMSMDYLSICFTTISNLSDRRIDRFMDKANNNGLPPFLCREEAGLRLGLMGGQFMSTSLTAENRSLCTPLSIQTLTSTGDFQDIVSMGLIAARRAQEIYNNTCHILAFELICACQAADIRGKEDLGQPKSKVHSFIRQKVPYLSEDICLTEHIETIAKSIESGEILKLVEEEFSLEL